jgi:hypothetical protein
MSGACDERAAAVLMNAKRLTRDQAEALALQAVAFLAERPADFLRFADLSGLSVDEIRSRLPDPALLGAVLDYVLYDDEMVQAFAAAAGVDSTAPRLARSLLPGAAPGN